MTPASKTALPRWISGRWDSRSTRAFVRLCLVLSAAFTLLCLTALWVIGYQAEACQQVVNSGLRATQDLELAVAHQASLGLPHANRQAEHASALRRAVEAVEVWRGFPAVLFLSGAEDCIADLLRRHRDMEAERLHGDLQTTGLSLQLPRIQDRLHELAGAWLRLSTSLMVGKSAIQRVLVFAIALACLSMLLLSLVMLRNSDVTVRRAMRFLEGRISWIASGEIFRPGPPVTGEELVQLPDSLAGFSESFNLLARLLQGHCQVVVKALDLVSPGVSLMSGDFRILAANHPFALLVGAQPASLQGKHLSEVLPIAMPALTEPGSGGSTPRGKDFVTLIKGHDGRQIYRARLTEILPGNGDDGVLALMLSDRAAAQPHHSDPAEFKRLYEKILESVSEAILLVERDGVVIDVSPAAAKMLGRSREELAGTRLQSLQMQASATTEEGLDTYFSSHHWQLDGRVLKTGVVRKDGPAFSAELTFREFRAGERAGYLVFLRDIAEQQLAESLSQERLRVIELIARNQPLETVLASVAELVEHQLPGSYCVVMLKQGNHLVPTIAPRLPAAFLESLGELPLESVIGVCVKAHGNGGGNLFNNIALQFASELPQDETLVAGIRSCLSAPVFSSEGLVVGLIAAFRPEMDEPRREHTEALQLASQLASVCIEQRELSGQLAYKAQHDPLTGLLNRCSFEERLNHAIAHANRYDRLLAVLSLDLDRFKLVNDTLGHASGDDLIRQLAYRLVESLRETDLIARWGGDEFVIGLVEIQSREDAERVAQKLLSGLAAPFDIAGRLTTVSASIGVSVFPVDGPDLDSLVRHADAAMYRTKRNGRNGFHCYDAAMGEANLQRLELETQVRRALDRGEFTVHYQPQIDLRTHQLVGVEALLRWQNQKFGSIQPSTFIPIAEECGAIVPIGEWVIREACRQVRELALAASGEVRVAVNVSRTQFARPDFVAMVSAALDEAGIEPHLLELELTESLLMEQDDDAVARMAELRALGIKMSIDDFGTGYSSLSYLQRLPIDHLKIDRSFVQELGASARTPLLVESIISLCASLGMLSIAEGVESPSQLDGLAAAGCNIVQGNLFCRAVPAQKLLTRIRSHGADQRWRVRNPARRRRLSADRERVPADVAVVA